MWGATATQGGRTAADSGEGLTQVVRRAPLRQPGVETGEATTRQLAERLDGIMVIGRRGHLTGFVLLQPEKNKEKEPLERLRI